MVSNKDCAYEPIQSDDHRSDRLRSNGLASSAPKVSPSMKRDGRYNPDVSVWPDRHAFWFFVLCTAVAKVSQEMDPSPPKLKILVADDSPVYRKLVEQSLAHDDYAVLLANNGHQAMESTVIMPIDQPWWHGNHGFGPASQNNRRTHG